MVAGDGAAQEPKKLKTVRIVEPSLATMDFYAVDDAGNVLIDWEATERLVSTKFDRIKLPIAQLMLAIRDGKWKPVPR